MIIHTTFPYNQPCREHVKVHRLEITYKNYKLVYYLIFFIDSSTVRAAISKTSDGFKKSNNYYQ